MNATATVTAAEPVVSAKALTIAYDRRDAAIARAQDLAAQVKSKRAELDALVGEAHAAADAACETTKAWAEAMRDHALQVENATWKLWSMYDPQMDEAGCDAILAFDPNGL